MIEKTNRSYLLLVALILCLNGPGFSQTGKKPIVLKNPQLEGLSKAGSLNGFAPSGWLDCSHADQTSVDIQPGHFDVILPAHEGNSYVGMVVRQDETWEGISQRLSLSLEAEQCYTFSLHLARSPIYLSRTKLSEQIENFANPAKLRIYGGNGYCKKNELLAESPLVANDDWKKYDFRFEPTENHSYILLEIFYNTPTLFPYNGNILVDDLSDINPIPCDQEQIEEKVIHPPIVNILDPVKDGMETFQAPFSFKADVANVPSKKNLTFLLNGNKHGFFYNSSMQSVTANVVLNPGVNRFKLVADTEDGNSQETRKVFYDPPTVVAKEKVFDPKVLTELTDRNNIQKGKVLSLKNVFFLADSTRIERDNYHILNELKDFLVANEDVEIEVMGHTNNRCRDDFCNILSEKRAKSVVDYLSSKGIPRRRLTYKGYGKENPIASNDTSAGRKKNQRVEIKITKISS